jgi:hypothetical protein
MSFLDPWATRRGGVDHKRGIYVVVVVVVLGDLKSLVWVTEMHLVWFVVSHVAVVVVVVVVVDVLRLWMLLFRPGWIRLAFDLDDDDCLVALPYLHENVIRMGV